MKIRKKPVIVDAVRFTGSNCSGVQALVGRRRFRLVSEDDTEIDPGTDAQVWDSYHSTWIGVRTGQWLILGVNGEVYPIEDDVLNKTYDVLDVEGEDSAST
jgi:hypothetical protein